MSWVFRGETSKNSMMTVGGPRSNLNLPKQWRSRTGTGITDHVIPVLQKKIGGGEIGGGTWSIMNVWFLVLVQLNEWHPLPGNFRGSSRQAWTKANLLFFRLQLTIDPPVCLNICDVSQHCFECSWSKQNCDLFLAQIFHCFRKPPSFPTCFTSDIGSWDLNCRSTRAELLLFYILGKLIEML